ncbi:MAG: GNAT family N-acetyltransferase [Chloroflexota bacterium]|nr:GNAT family N-acetyltransferase [Chloroflexota bacterium]
MTDLRAKPTADNIAAFLMEMGRAGGGEERRDREIVWTVGGSPLGYHNAVVHCDASPERADALIDEWAAELRDRGLPGSWHISPFMQPDDLAGRLASRGFVDGGEEPAMVADLGHAPVELPPLQDLAIQRVRDDADIDAYRRVLASGFGEGPREADWVTDIWRRIGLGDDVAWRHYVGYLTEASVCTVSLLVTGDVTGIYFVSTSPDVRRRGIGAAVTRHAMVEARALGCTTAVLGASAMGYSVYRRLGFEEVFRYRMLEWSPGTRAESVTEPG